MSPRPFKHFSPKEKELLRGWLAAGKTRAEAARLLGRDLSTVVRQAKLLKRRGPPPTKGRRALFLRELSLTCHLQ